jgi:hypothetical protein
MHRRFGSWLSSLMLMLFAIAVLAAPLFAEEGFVPLFDGKTLRGWIGATDGYVVRDGAIVCDEKTGGNLFTAKQYSDFVLRLDVLIPADGNNGIGLRSPNLQGNRVYDAIEIQVLDDRAEKHKSIQPWQHHGSVYGVIPAVQGSLRPAGEWNEQEITLQGRRIQVVVNGKTIVDGDLDQAAKNGTVDGKEHPGLRNAAGHIGFLGHGSAVAFRNIRLRELPASK